MNHELLVSTTIRYQDYGYLYIVDFSNNVVRRKKKIRNDNPVAKHGGPHGLAVDDERIIVATFSDIRMFNQDLKQIDSFSHPYMTDIHGISVNDGKIWISCTNNEGVFAFDFEGNLLEEYFLTENTQLMSRLGESVQEVDRDQDFRDFRRPYEEHPFHVNHVHETNQGLEVSLHKQGTIWDLKGQELLAGLNSSAIHDGQSWDGGYFINDTLNEESVFLEANGNEISRTAINFYDQASSLDHLAVISQEYLHKVLHKFHLWVPSLISPRKCFTNWVRGFHLGKSTDDVAYVGGSPAVLYRLNFQRGRVSEGFVLSRNLCEAVFDLAPMPSKL